MAMFSLVKQYGFKRIIKGIFRRFYNQSKLNYFISYLKYKKCIYSGKPYFGEYMAAKLGSTVRHYFMQKLVEGECQKAKRQIKILEIGSWAGGSSISFAEAITKWGGRLYV